MKTRNFLSLIVTMITSLFLPLYNWAEKRFTLGIIDGLATTTRATQVPADSAPSNGTNININVKSPGVIDQSEEPIIDPMSSRAVIPNTMTQNVASATGAGDENVTAYFLNEDAFNATPTNNGSGANSVVITYSDGWTGLGYNQLSRSANGGRGVLCYGFTLIYKVTSGGAQDPTGLAGANPSYIAYNNVNGGEMAVGEPLNEGFRADNYQLGTMTLLRKFYLCSVNQISYVVPPGDTATMIVLTKPQRA